jgi:HAD superfamily hydrolase (TIGR01548 family)
VTKFLKSSHLVSHSRFFLTFIGNANNDWELTHKLLKLRELANLPSLEEVTQVFEEFYQGTAENPGLWTKETILINSLLLQSFINKSIPLAIVTGRPRSDAERLLKVNNLDKYFSVVVCMEDAAKKPDPAPVLLALNKLGLKSGRKTYMIGKAREKGVADK